MRHVAGVVIILLVVVGIAVSGSRAGPLPATSVAFQQCQRSGLLVTDHCAPIVRDDDVTVYSDYYYMDDSEPDWHWRVLVARLVLEASKWFAEHFSGSPTAMGALPEATWFDLD